MTGGEFNPLHAYEKIILFAVERIRKKFTEHSEKKHVSVASAVYDVLDGSVSLPE